MKNTVKRLACLLLAILMLFSVAACKKNNTSSELSEGVIGYEVVGGSSDSAQSDVSDKTDSTQSNSNQNSGSSSGGDQIINQSSKGAKVVNNCYVTGYPVAKETVTLKVMMVGDDLNGDDPSKRALTKFIEQKFNIKLDFETIGNASVTSKIPLEFASGKTADLYWGMGLLGGVSALENYVSAGKLYSYDDYKEYAPNVYKIFKENKDVQYQCTSADGKIYTVPLYRDDSDIYTDLFYINKTWLKKLGLSMPKTINDLTNVLRKFRDNDPNGNGKKDEIPMMFVEDIPSSWYGFWGMSCFNSFRTRTKDNKIKCVYLMNEYKDAMSTLADYYSEGLLYNSEIRNMNSLKAASRMNASVKTVGVIGGNIISYSNVMDSETYVNHYSLMPIIDATGKGEQVGSYMDLEMCWPCWGFISKTCKYPEIAVRLMDYFYTLEGAAVGWYGPPSKSTYWNYNSNGEPVLNNNGTNYYQFSLGHFIPRYMSDEVLHNFFVNKKNYSNKTDAQAVALDTAERKNVYGNLKPRLTYNLPNTAAEQEKAKVGVSSNLSNTQKEWAFSFIYGTKNIDSQWSTYIDEMTRLGAKISEEIAQAADTRMQDWLKKNK